MDYGVTLNEESKSTVFAEDGYVRSAKLVMKDIEGKVNNHGETQNEEGRQRRNEIAHCLIEAKRYDKEALYDDAKQSVEKALFHYQTYVDRKPPVSVQLMYGNMIEKSGNLPQALTMYHEQYIKHHSVNALIKLGYACINLRDLTLLKQYEQACIEGTQLPTISLNQKLHLRIIVGYLFSFTERDTSFVQEMVQYHKGNSQTIREKLRVGDYIRWIYNLHILQLLNNRPWEERAAFIFEAESLAEQYEQTSMLINIYNLLAIGLLEENVTRATEYMQKSKKLAIKLGNKQHEMLATTNLFMFYLFIGDTNHAIELAEQAKTIGEVIHSDFNEIGLVKLFYQIEDDTTALKLINDLKPKVRKKKLTITKVDALLFHYKIILRQNGVGKAKRLLPFIEKVCQKYKTKVDLLFIQCQYFMVLKEYQKTIEIATNCLKEENLTVEYRLEFSLILLDLYSKLNEHEAFTELIHDFENLVYTKGYLAYVGYVNFYKAHYYLKNELYIKARVNFIRAKSYFRRMNNLRKQADIDQTIEMIDQQSLKKESKKQQETLQLLTRNELMFDSIRLVHSAKHLDEVCKHITKILHENLQLKRVFFYFRIDRKRTKTMYVSDKLQTEEVSEERVFELIRKVTEEKNAQEFEFENSYFHGFPIFSDDHEVVSIVLIEYQNNLLTEEISFLEQLLPFIAPKIEKVIFHELVQVDDLTKLYNRNYFMKRLQEEFQKTISYQADLSFIMIDIDDFRYVNNQFGHTEGDRILEKVATTIQNSVRSSDIVGRYGGEELIVILPNTNSDIAKIVADRILHEIRKIHVNDVKQLTASIGVSSADKEEPMTSQELIDKADLAERYAKEHGKNQVICYWEMTT